MIESFNAFIADAATLDAFEGRQQFRQVEMIIKGPSKINNTLQL